MWIARTIEDARRQRAALPGRVAFVPTMGALHDGHVSLIHAGKKLAEHVVVSVFVNPTQFGRGEDYTRYPRPEEQDLAKCSEAGAAGVLVPAVEEMYPPNRPECVIDVPAVATDLEGRFRPGHFRGVCRVVAKLFNIIGPDVACFGRKDYQQLKVIEAMVADLNMPVNVVGLPTVRERDGLAMSSRNVYLTTQTRPRALALHKALMQAKSMIEDEGETDPAAVEAAMRAILTANQVWMDYAFVRHPHTLGKIDCIEPGLTGGVVALIAGRVDNVRLIDNMVLAEPRAKAG